MNRLGKFLAHGDGFRQRRLARRAGVDRLTQTAFGRLAGMSQSFVSDICSGRRLPGRDHALKIQGLAGIPVSYWARVCKPVAAPPAERLGVVRSESLREARKP